MRNLVMTVIVLASALSCRAQSVIPLEGFKDYDQELPDNAYVKDLNNIRDKFVGTWSGTHDNKNYVFEIEKYTRNSENRGLKFDNLRMRYKITDASGNVIANTLDLPDDSPYIIRSSYIAETGSYVLDYQGFNAACGQNGSVFMAINPNDPDKMGLGLAVQGEVYSECDGPDATQVLPTSAMNLVRQ